MKAQSLKSFKQKFSYSGHILSGPYSGLLQKRLIRAMIHLDALEQFGSPVIPYIAAWRPDDNYIWYEYCGKRFHDLLGQPTTELANTFRDHIVSRYLYRYQGNPPTITKITRDKEQLDRMRPGLRRMVMRGGEADAVYKVAINGSPLWLKDLAKVEVFAEDNIVLSWGSLIDVSSEMRLEEALVETQQELNIHKEHLELLVDKRTRELHKSQLEVVSRLTQALACRHDESGLHGQRLRAYSSILGSALGLKKGVQWLLSQAVPMHDVGKVGISDAILLKEGALSPPEFDIIKTHCQMGADLLQGGNSQLLQVARVVALTHHERWDGSGYPHGLEKHRIPLAGRITALCDVFDALTSPRCYKSTWSFEDATDEIDSMRNIHFDPKLVDLFMVNLPKIRRVIAQTNLATEQAV
ncbi:MAG: HD domain-containing protein [Proteobacteria bacterium]|nr:HD domain-containing protein [Pseudomonadota bacterium]MBU1639738.1 HD domain-containing protein [Pseudomonadota bacterium]